MDILRSTLAAAFAFIAASVPALADDAPFLNTDPASVVAKGDTAVQQWLSWAHGQSGTSFNAFESLTEFDYGLTDRIQLALTVSNVWTRVKAPGSPAEVSDFPGLAAEVIIVALPTDTSPIGVAFAVDPAIDSTSHGIAGRVLLTKYILGFENVLNINFEDNWSKDDNGHWQGQGAVSFNYGIARALDKHWTLGLEFGNQFTFSRLVTDVAFANFGTTLFLGPSLQYDSGSWVVTAGLQLQLPRKGYDPEAERMRAGLRFSTAI